jgi:hypothetical protein
MRIVAEKHARPLHADAAAAVRMIHEDEFAAVGVRFFQRRELSRFGAERLIRSDCGVCEKGKAKAQGCERAARWSGGVMEHWSDHFRQKNGDRRMSGEGLVKHGR